MSGENWFAYTDSNPVNRFDRDGKTMTVVAPDPDSAVIALEAARGSEALSVLGRVENLVMYIDSQMAEMQAVCQGLVTDRPGGQLILRYISSINGDTATFRFDFASKAIDLGGFARNAFNTTGVGHAWKFADAMACVARLLE